MRIPLNLTIRRLNLPFLIHCKAFGTTRQTEVAGNTQSPALNVPVTTDSKKAKKTSKKSVTKPDKDELGNPDEPVTQLLESEDKSVVLRKPIPKNFIKETLLPHLEHNVAYNCMKFPPEVVLQIGIAYSKLPHFIRQRSIEDALIESFRYRMVDYTASDCIQLLNTCLKLQGLRSTAVYDDIISRLEVPHVYNSINPLNRLGICRSISKIISHSHHITNASSNDSSSDKSVSKQLDSTNTGVTDIPPNDNLNQKDLFKVDFNEYNDIYTTSPIRPWSFWVKNYRDKRIATLVDRLSSFCENRILPQVEYELKQFDSDELTDLLGVLAQRSERDGSTLDFPVISILMSNIMRLYPTTSLLNSLSNLSSLCRLRIRHDEFLNRVVEDLRNPLKVNNIYHKHLSRCIWSLARFDLLISVVNDLFDHIGRNVPRFEPACFARLAQVAKYYQFSEESMAKRFKTLVEKTCLSLLSKVDTFSPKDLTFFLSGLMHANLIPTDTEYTQGTVVEIKPKFEKDERYIPRAGRHSSTLLVLERVLECLRSTHSDFDLWEIERLIEATRSFPEYTYLLDHFPESWRNIINPTDK